MAKRKTKAVEEKKKKAKLAKDAQLSLGLFSNDVDVDENKADWENEEQSYELKPRIVENKQVVEGLPIKTSEGKVKRVQREDDFGKKQQAPESESEEVEEEEQKKDGDENDENKQDEFEGDLNLSPKERLIKIKEEIADLASKLMEDPEENTSCLTRLRKMSMSKNMVVCQLAILSLIPTFKSLAPGYRIRPLSEAEKKEKVSRDVAKLRQFEQALIYNYKLYIDNLGQLAKVSKLNSENNKKITQDQVTLGQLSIKACCELITSSLRHFNNRNDLFTIIIRRLNKKPKDAEDYEIFTKCLRVLESLLVDDKEHGEITHEIVKILCKSIGDKNFRVDESVVNILLSLSLLDDYNPTEDDQTKKHEKVNKKDRVHLSKKEKKARKEAKEIEQELEKAQQTITQEEREKYQSKTLQMVLKLYLEILKAGSQSVNLSESKQNDASLLMAPVLEGLSRFGKMANFDLLGDFLEVLREIMLDIIENHSLDSEEDDSIEGGLYDGRQIRTILLCIVTSFSLTLNHASMGKLPISIDLSKFASSLYLVLTDMSLDCDLEFGHKSLRLLDPLSETNRLEKPSVNVSTKSELLLHSLDSVFFRSKNGSISRAISFTKRLYMSILHTPEKTSLATLKFIGKLVNRHGESLKGLWDTEEKISGEGSYNLGTERPDKEVELDRCNAAAATLWENVLLDKHYSPMVRDGSRSLMKMSKMNDRR